MFENHLQALHPAHCLDQGGGGAAGVHWAVHPPKVEEVHPSEVDEAPPWEEEKNWKKVKMFSNPSEESYQEINSNCTNQKVNNSLIKTKPLFQSVNVKFQEP